jgi:hypothetical protein
MANQKQKHCIDYRPQTGKPERFEVVYDLPDRDLQLRVSNWESEITGSFVGFNKLDPKWWWTMPGEAVVTAENKVYILSATALGRFTLRPRLAHA